jgi:hypothetical protein
MFFICIFEIGLFITEMSGPLIVRFFGIFIFGGYLGTFLGNSDLNEEFEIRIAEVPKSSKRYYCWTVIRFQY